MFCIIYVCYELPDVITLDAVLQVHLASHLKTSAIALCLKITQPLF